MIDKKKDKRFLSYLAKVAPGTPLRSGIDQIVKAKTGALIVIGEEEKVLPVADGGFLINCEFTAHRLYELAKMDGAIIIDPSIGRIIRANVQLIPDPAMPTSETGTRHRAAERTARQTGAFVISISQRSDLVSLYFEDIKHVMDDIRVITDRANQALRTLERYRERLNEVYADLTSLELKGMATVLSVASVLQRIEMVMLVAREIERYVIELGTEGRLINMQLKELILDVVNDCVNTLRDYAIDPSEENIQKLRQKILLERDEKVLEIDEIACELGYNSSKGDSLNRAVAPRGYRVLAKAYRLPFSTYDAIVKKYGALDVLLRSSVDELASVDGMDVEKARNLLRNLHALKQSLGLERGCPDIV